MLGMVRYSDHWQPCLLSYAHYEEGWNRGHDDMQLSVPKRPVRPSLA